MFRRAFGRKNGATGRQPWPAESDVTLLAGSAKQDVVGESYYQDALTFLCGGRTRDGHELAVLALLIPEPANPHDSNAVAVRVSGHKVGHLPRAVAAKLQRPLIDLAQSAGKPVGCRAKIVGGWNRGRNDRGHFGVQLFFDPAQLTGR